MKNNNTPKPMWYPPLAILVCYILLSSVGSYYLKRHSYLCYDFFNFTYFVSFVLALLALVAFAIYSVMNFKLIISQWIFLFFVYLGCMSQVFIVHYITIEMYQKVTKIDDIDIIR